MDSIPETKIIKILDDYFDFELLAEIQKSTLKNSNSWIVAQRDYFDFRREKLESMEVRITSLVDILVLNNIFCVKNHPLLCINFLRDEKEMAHNPSKFTGLSINAFHRGSWRRSFDLLKFKPEIDAYLHSIGIGYKDRSQVEF